MRAAALGGLLIAGIGIAAGAMVIVMLLGDRVSTVPVIGKLLLYLLFIITGVLICLAARTVGIAVFLSMAWDGFMETSELFGL